MNPMRLGVFSALQGVRNQREKRQLDKVLRDAASAKQGHESRMQPMLEEQLRLSNERARNPAMADEPLETILDEHGKGKFVRRSQAVGQRPYERPTSEPLVQVPGPDGRPIYTTRDKAIGQEAPSPSGMGSASIKTKVAANRTQSKVIDDALRELDAYPQAVGLTKGLPFIGDRLDPRTDPKGVAARASIANIGSLKVHDRSGAAVSVSEFPRLAPFIPNIYDPPEAIRIKLAKLREALEVETQELERSGTVAPSPDSSRPVPAARPKQGADVSALLKKYGLEE